MKSNQLIVSEKQAKLNRVVTLNLTILRISKRPVFLLLSLVHGKCYSNNDHKNNSGSRLQLLCFDSLNKREVNREEYRSKLSIKYRASSCILTDCVICKLFQLLT